MNDLSVQNDDLFDKIERYYLQSAPLTEKEKEICERWELAFALLCTHRNKKVAVSKFTAKIEASGQTISQAQVYRDFSAAEKLFTPLRKYSKEFLRLVLIESALKDVKAAERKAASATSIKDWTAIMSIKNNAEKRIIDASGLQLNDPNLPDFSKLQPTEFKLNVDPEIMKMMQKVLGSGVVDVTQVINNMAEDAEIVDDNEHGMENGSQEG